jgi:competence transcription factor ComK
MSTTKCITINPQLFKSGGQSKTKRTRTPTEIPIISPNILKNKLIGRIKEHKNREASNLEITPISQKPMLVDQSLFDFNNEFNKSIDYLQIISKQKRVNQRPKGRELQLKFPLYRRIY